MLPKTLVLLATPLLLVLFASGASASIPMGACVNGVTAGTCDDAVCAWVEAKTYCGPHHLTPIVVCVEGDGACQPPWLACVAGPQEAFCVEDFCYNAPEWCDIGN
jgi:hypothetical protein